MLPLIETARGLAAVAAIAAHPRTARLLFGALDMQLDLDIEDEDEGLLLFRSQLVLASRLAGLPPPLDGVTATLRPEALSRDARRARRLGFGGKLCIHPPRSPRSMPPSCRPRRSWPGRGGFARRRNAPAAAPRRWTASW